MKAKLCLIFIFSILISQVAYSSGALRFILPFLSSIGGQLKEGEIAYDSSQKLIVFKTDNDLIPLSNPDLTPQSNFPLIESNTTYEDAFTSSYIQAGKIRIGNKVYSNSSSITCIHKPASPVIGLGRYDGSVSTVTPPMYFNKPMYLYLITSGSGFNCILSYKSTGPASPYNNTRWLRAATFAGAAGAASYRTEAGFTKSVGGSIYLSFPPHSTVQTLPSTLTSSMKYLALEGFKCNEVDYFEFYSKGYEISDITNLPVERMDRVESCSYTDDDAEPAIFYPVNSQVFSTGDHANPINIRIKGWAEIQLTSI